MEDINRNEAVPQDFLDIEPAEDLDMGDSFTEDELTASQAATADSLAESYFERVLRSQERGLAKDTGGRNSTRDLRDFYDMDSIIPADGKALMMSDPAAADRYRSQLIEYSYNTGTILTGHISSVAEETVYGKDMMCAKVRYGTTTVLIPFEVCVPLSSDEGGVDRTTLTKTQRNRLLDLRSDSIIDFRIVKINDDHTAIASRLEAMAIKRNMFFKKHGRRYMLNEGDIVEARICVVARNFMVVEVFGIEKRIWISDVSYKRMESVHQMYEPGLTIPVKITKLVRDETDKNHKRVTAFKVSVKDAEYDPRRHVLENIRVGETMFGTIVAIAGSNIYVKPREIEMDIPCTKKTDDGSRRDKNGGEGMLLGIVPMVGDRVKIRIQEVYLETNSARGIIQAFL